MKRLWLFSIVALGSAGAGFSQPAQAPVLPALSLVQPGQWALKARDAAENRSICVADPRALLQVRHNGFSCNRFVIASNAKDATVHYSCPGAGYGRTTLRVETPRLVQIESQGIADQEPFAVTFEARRVGECGARTSALRR